MLLAGGYSTGETPIPTQGGGSVVYGTCPKYADYQHFKLFLQFYNLGVSRLDR